jgi:hypothetical protein
MPRDPAPWEVAMEVATVQVVAREAKKATHPASSVPLRLADSTATTRSEWLMGSLLL